MRYLFSTQVEVHKSSWCICRSAGANDMTVDTERSISGAWWQTNKNNQHRDQLIIRSGLPIEPIRIRCTFSNCTLSIPFTHCSAVNNSLELGWRAVQSRKMSRAFRYVHTDTHLLAACREEEEEEFTVTDSARYVVVISITWCTITHYNCSK